MADPILPDFFRAQAIWQGTTNLPEDVFVNSFVFRNDQAADAEALATTIHDRLRDFYTVAHGAAANPISYFFCNRIMTGDFTVKVYDLGQAPPRIPIERVSQHVVGTGVAIPSEVACCISYYAGQNTPRHRGRIYIGPFNDKGLSSETVHGSKPNAVLRDSLLGAAAWLADEGIGGANWHVLSTVDQVAREITGGWVDNAWDTQRRRGEAPTDRDVWGAAPGA